MTKQLIAALALTALILLPASAALADDKKTDDAADKKASHDIYATVVSVDPDAKTLTFRGPDGNELSGDVKGDAVSKIRDLRPGQQVTLVVSEPSMAGTAPTKPVITDIKLEKASEKKG